MKIQSAQRAIYRCFSFSAAAIRKSIPMMLVLAIPVGAAQPTEQIRFGLGRSVTPEEIAAWDIDVKPDGSGLPAGSGSAASGATIFAAKCAACHGKTGVEGPFDVLVGRLPDDVFPFANEPAVVKTIGNYWPYATTVFDYINRAMPFTAPGSLSADEVYSLVAFLLVRNEILPQDVTLSAENLAAVVMPARDRFVPDDRRGGPQVR